MVFSARLPGLLVDDELPCAFRRERVQGVSSGRHFGAADIESAMAVVSVVASLAPVRQTFP